MCPCRPGLFIWALGIQIQVLVFAWQELYQANHLFPSSNSFQVDLRKVLIAIFVGNHVSKVSFPHCSHFHHKAVIGHHCPPLQKKDLNEAQGGCLSCSRLYRQDKVSLRKISSTEQSWDHDEIQTDSSLSSEEGMQMANEFTRTCLPSQKCKSKWQWDSIPVRTAITKNAAWVW